MEILVFNHHYSREFIPIGKLVKTENYCNRLQRVATSFLAMRAANRPKNVRKKTILPKKKWAAAKNKGLPVG